MINTKASSPTTIINPFVKIASRMLSLGFYAVAQSNYVKISHNIREYENHYVMLCDRNVNIRSCCAAMTIILTDYAEQDKYIIESNGILYISKYLGENCICELLKYHLKRNDKNIQIRKYVTKILSDLGVPANLTGYNYLKTAIELYVQNENLYKKAIMNLYAEIAGNYQTNARCVERSIRTVIDTIYYKTPTRIENFFSYPVGKPRSSELIVLIAEKIRFLLE
jgi:sporulation transcription factor spo0A